MKKILVVTPRFPIPDAGACEKDRLAGIKLLKYLGYDVRVIGKVFDFQNRDDVDNFSKEFNVPTRLIPYKFARRKSIFHKILSYVKRAIWPPYWDGSSYEYTDPEIRSVLRQTLDEWRPDLVWFDYTYLWPLYGLARRKKIPIITRSINFEARHFLEEDGRSIRNYIRFLPKLITEYVTLKLSDLLFSITPAEEKMYKKLCPACPVVNLPLRGLPSVLASVPAVIRPAEKFNVFFIASTYNVAHNRRALEFILKNIVPKIDGICPGKYIFHIFGAKVPESFYQYRKDNVIFHGHVAAIGEALREMDIAVIPSLYGAGMQQKIFESLSRGFPTIMSPRGLAGYPFVDQEHFISAVTADDFVRGLIKLQDLRLRVRLSAAAASLARELFSPEAINFVVKRGIDNLLNNKL